MPERSIFPAFLLSRAIFIGVKTSEFKQLLAEAIEEIHKETIDAFLHEFAGFDPKVEKKRLKTMANHLVAIHRHANNELYNGTSAGVYTRKFWKFKEDIEKLNEKIKRYEANKDVIDSLARKHNKHVFHTHGKIV